MKIYSRQEFLKLPTGIIFAKGKPAYFESLCIKGDTWFNRGKTSDFLYLDIGHFEDVEGKDFCDTFDLMVETGLSRPLNSTLARDGCFDDEDLFLVFEVPDLERLIFHAQNAIRSLT